MTNYLIDRPWNDRCMLPPEIRKPPPVIPVRLYVPVRVPVVQLSSRRSTSDKTGQATRNRIRAALLKKHGPICWLCAGVIDLDLKWPAPGCFTRDHVKPRSLKGSNSIRNQRPAHKVCNESRGNKIIKGDQ
jgi:5-methylcytosine-specific restriction endonuclease McrA